MMNVNVDISFGTIKSLLIFFAPVLIPRAINLYRTLRVSIKHRPQPRPLPSAAARALNVLFGAIVLFLVLSLPFNPYAPDANVFTVTRSRLNTPTDVLFTRLARHRPQTTLSARDTLLKSKFTTLTARNIYLRFGPDTLISCPFCSPDSIKSYLLYYLPFHTFLPHLFHMLIIGLVTSAPFAGRDAATWRNKFTLAGLALAAIDIYLVSTYDPVQRASPIVRAGQSPPASFYNQMTLLRPLAFALFDGVAAILVYLSATNRLFFTPPSQAEQVEQLVGVVATTLTSATSKLHAVNVTRNAVVRDRMLKMRDDVYWRTVVAMEGDAAAGAGASMDGRSPGNGNGNGNGNGTSQPASVWEEEEVVRAMSRAMAGQGEVDLARLRTSASEYVNGVTAGLEGRVG